MKFFEKIKNNKSIQYIFLGVLSVILIVIFAYSFTTREEKNTSSEYTVDSYVRELEDKLSNTLSKVDGAGKVSVMITVKSGLETVIATEKESVTENGKTITTEVPVMVNGKVVVLMEKYPKITGVLIVAQGADSIIVMQKIQQATVSLLDIEISQIEILTMK